MVDIFELLTRRVIDKIQSGQIDPKSVANGILTEPRMDVECVKGADGSVVSKWINLVFCNSR